MRTVKELAQATDPLRARVAGAIRRMAITLTAKTLWQLTGFLFPDGTRETTQAETFLGIGFHARPSTTGKPEAIVVMVHDAQNPVVIAVRDEKTRAAIAGALAANETAMFNDTSLVHIKGDGTIDARSSGGTAVPLATKADIDALKAWIATHVHGGSGTPPTTTPPSAAGTSKLKGE